MAGQNKVFEINFDGLIGPTHNFAGLSFGNMASTSHQNEISYPKQAALDGLKKMQLLHSLGLKQGIMPPQIRPNFSALKTQGYSGSDEHILTQVGQDNFPLLLQCSSASSMWVANAATIACSADTQDGKVHITPANLKTHAHRRFEVQQTCRSLHHIFKSDAFVMHEPLNDNNDTLLDEGAANHMRLSAAHSNKGLNIFVYGKESETLTGKFPARQTREASQQIARSHQLDDDTILFVQQNPDAIDQGVFHNDVIAMSNENVLIYHENAFIHTQETIEKINHKFKNMTGEDVWCIPITNEQLSIKEAVDSYLFNSQLVTKPNGDMIIIAPYESKKGRAQDCLNTILQGNNPITDIKFVNLQQSMANGGGPACLRLRVALTESQLKQLPKGIILTDATFAHLEDWINQHYRDELHQNELKNYLLYKESCLALRELTKILDLGLVYSF